MSSFNYWQFFGGIALFVYAMNLIETSLKKLAGRSFKKFLQKHSQSSIKVLATSTVVTALLQSSSIVVLMVLSFVGAGLMKMPNALAAVLGSNLGTTLDSWVIALIGFKFNFNQLSLPVLTLALIGLLFFSRKEKISNVVNFLFGFALIFISLEWLKLSLDKSIYVFFGDLNSYSYYVFIPVGFVITAIIQSSSATMIINLAALHNGLVSFESSACILIGSELGTTLKFLIGSVNGLTEKKQVAWGNFFINLITMLLASILLVPLINLTHFFIGTSDVLAALVLFQTIINLISIILFLPFLNKIASILEKQIKGKNNNNLVSYLNFKENVLPSHALELAKQEIKNLYFHTIKLNKMVFGINDKENESWYKKFTTIISESYIEFYENIKNLQGEILEYLSLINQLEITLQENAERDKLITIVRHIMRSTKNMKDIKHNILDFESSGNDKVFVLYSDLKRMELEFYNDFILCIEANTSIEKDKIISLITHNKNEYNIAIKELLQLVKTGEIKEVESVTFLMFTAKFILLKRL